MRFFCDNNNAFIKKMIIIVLITIIILLMIFGRNHFRRTRYYNSDKAIQITNLFYNAQNSNIYIINT